MRNLRLKYAAIGINIPFHNYENNLIPYLNALPQEAVQSLHGDHDVTTQSTGGPNSLRSRISAASSSASRRASVIASNCSTKQTTMMT